MAASLAAAALMAVGGCAARCCPDTISVAATSAAAFSEAANRRSRYRGTRIFSVFAALSRYIALSAARIAVSGSPFGGM